MDIGVAPPLTVGFVAGVASATGAVILGGGVLGALLAYSVGGAAGIVGAAAWAARAMSDDGDGGQGRDRARDHAAAHDMPADALPAFAGAALPGRRA